MFTFFPMTKAKRISSRRSRPYDNTVVDTANTEVKTEPPSSETPSIKPEEEAPVFEIPEVTPPPEPTPNEKRFAYLMQHAILSFTLPGYGTFLLVRVPETTDNYKLGIVRSDGTVVEPSKDFTIHKPVTDFIAVNKVILKFVDTDRKQFFLTTDNEWKSLLLTNKQSPNHRYFYLTRYVKRDLNGLPVERLLKDDFTLKSNDGKDIPLNLSFIKAKSPELRRYLDENSTGSSRSLDYSAAAIKALVGHLYGESAGELNYHSALELWKMIRILRLQNSGIDQMAEREMLRWKMKLPEALEIWKITRGESDEVRRHCLQQFRWNISSLKSSNEFYELFKSQQFTIDEIVALLKDLSPYPSSWS